MVAEEVFKVAALVVLKVGQKQKNNITAIMAVNLNRLEALLFAAFKLTFLSLFILLFFMRAKVP